MDWLHSEVDGGNIDGQSLRQPVLAIQLNRIENIERENFDGSLAKRQIRQNFPCQNFPLYGITRDRGQRPRSSVNSDILLWVFYNNNDILQMLVI